MMKDKPLPPRDVTLDDAQRSAPSTPDMWATLRQATKARIGLGRAGNAIPLAEVLKFQAAHARARDAVHAALDVETLEARLAPLSVLKVESQAPDRSTYLRRPDLGRLLAPRDEETLKAAANEPYDIVFVVADGLSSTAVGNHAAALVHVCRAALPDLRIAPVVIARQARVAIADPIGEHLRARLSVVLIGERPGLTVSDSLGLYMTYGPRPGRRDSERNCISNIHTHGGQSYEQAARTLSWLVREAFRLSLSGINLKDDLPSDTIGQAPDVAQIPKS